MAQPITLRSSLRGQPEDGGLHQAGEERKYWHRPLGWRTVGLLPGGGEDDQESSLIYREQFGDGQKATGTLGGNTLAQDGLKLYMNIYSHRRSGGGLHLPGLECEPRNTVHTGGDISLGWVTPPGRGANPL